MNLIKGVMQPMPQEAEKAQDKHKRAKRVQRLKKIILIGLALAILLPILLCIILFKRIDKLEKEVEVLRTKEEAQRLIQLNEEVEKTLAANQNMETDSENKILTEGQLPEEESSADEKENTTEKTVKVYLTFDDGPSSYTNDILDILNQYDVHATFFVVGKIGEKYDALYRRITQDGNTIGMHSFSHKYSEIYKDKEAFANDLTKLQEYIYEVTGTWSRIYRFPGGSSNTVSNIDMKELIAYLNEQDIAYYDWNVSSLDATSKVMDVEEIVHNVIENINNHSTSMVLMHDAEDKRTTVEALPIILERLKEMENVEILPITDDTIKVQHVKIEQQ